MGFLSGITDALFGAPAQSTNSSESSSTSRSGSQQNIFGPQANLLQSRYYPYVGNLMGQYGSNPQSLVAGFNPTQQFGQNLGLQNAMGLQGYAQNAQGALNQTLDPMSAFNEPLFQRSLQASLNPFIRNFQQSIIPSINSQAVGVGQRGGSRQGIAEGNAALGLIDKIGDMGAVYAQAAHNQGINQRLSGLGMANQIGQLGMAPSQYIQDIGGLQQQQQQRYLNAPVQFGSQIQSLIGNPTVLGRSFGQSDATSTSTSSGTQTGQGNGIMDAALGAGMLFGTGGFFPV